MHNTPSYSQLGLLFASRHFPLVPAHPGQLLVAWRYLAGGWTEVSTDWHEAAAGPSGIYSGVQIWMDTNADVGPSREYNIDLAPKVPRSGLHDRAMVHRPSWKHDPIASVKAHCPPEVLQQRADM